MKRFWTRDGRIKVKICGFTCLDTAYEAAKVGADALGFHVWRHYDVAARVEQLRRITQYLPADVSAWLLTDITDGATVRRVVEALRIDTVQLQGPVPAIAFVHLMQALAPARDAGRLRIVKSISAAPGDAATILRTLMPYGEMVDAWLLDSGWKGGTGQRHDWDVSAKVRRELSLPLILAGGLNSDNIEEAIEIVDPYGVDVESGVEIVVGVEGEKRVRCKSIEKIRAFVEAAHCGRPATKEVTHGVPTARHLEVVSQSDRPRHDDVG